MNILAFSGSLRKRSCNSALLRIAQSVAPAGVVIEIYDLAALPMFNEDLREPSYPPVVAAFIQKVLTADALLVATPEYDHYLPAALLSAFEWLSDDNNPDRALLNKPVALMTASATGFGGARAQLQFQAMSFPWKIKLLNNFSVTVSKAKEKFDAEGNCLDPHITEKVQKLVVDLQHWTEQVSNKAA